MSDQPASPPDPAKPPRRPYTMSEAAQEQRRNAAALSTGPTTDEGKAASSRNGFKHGAYSAVQRRQFDMGRHGLAALFQKPCLTTCPMHPDNPERIESPCSLVTSGRTRAGGDCLDKSVYVEAFDHIIAALNQRPEGIDALMASEAASALQMVHEMRTRILRDDWTVTIPAVDKHGEVIIDPTTEKAAPAKILAHPLIPWLWRSLEVLGISLPALNVTPQARAKSKTEEESAGALQTAMAMIAQRVNQSRFKLPAPAVPALPHESDDA